MQTNRPGVLISVISFHLSVPFANRWVTGRSWVIADTLAVCVRCATRQMQHAGAETVSLQGFCRLMIDDLAKDAMPDNQMSEQDFFISQRVSSSYVVLEGDSHGLMSQLQHIKQTHASIMAPSTSNTS